MSTSPPAALAVNAIPTPNVAPSPPRMREGDHTSKGEIAVEVLVMWQDVVLHVAHLAPPRLWMIGDFETDPEVDYPVPELPQGVARLPLLIPAGKATACVVFPADADGHFIDETGATHSLAEARSLGLLFRSARVRHAEEAILSAGCRASVLVGALTFRVGAMPALRRKPAARWSTMSWILCACVALSVVVHVVVLGAMMLS